MSGEVVWLGVLVPFVRDLIVQAAAPTRRELVVVYLSGKRDANGEVSLDDRKQHDVIANVEPGVAVITDAASGDGILTLRINANGLPQTIVHDSPMCSRLYSVCWVLGWLDEHKYPNPYAE